MIKEQGKKGILGLLACLIALLLIVADVFAAETRGLSFSYPVSNYSPDYQAFGNKNKFVNNNKHLGEDMRLSVGTAMGNLLLSSNMTSGKNMPSTSLVQSCRLNQKLTIR